MTNIFEVAMITESHTGRHIKGSLGTKVNTTPAAVKLRPVVSDIYKTLPNKAEWMRGVIEDRMIQEGWLARTVKIAPDGKEIVEYESLIAI